MMRALALPMILMAIAAPAVAEPRPEHPAPCRVAQHLVVPDFPLPHTARAITARKLTVLVVGAGSSRLPVPGGSTISYPARLAQALTQALPGVAVKVATDVKPHRTAAVMVRTLAAELEAEKPALVVWQTGTVDAMQAVDTDDFSETLEQGFSLARSAGADVVLVNAQYSPHTESMIALGIYADAMRWVALQYEQPLFDRYGIMTLWADLGTFEFADAAHPLDTAEQVHDCLGRLLADLIVAGAKLDGPEAGRR